MAEPASPSPIETIIKEAYAKAIECCRDKRYADARTLCLEILRLDPTFGPAWDRLAHVEEDEGRLSDALLHYQLAAKLLADPAPAHNNAGVVAQRCGDRQTALFHYQQAELHGLANPVLHSNIAALLREEGKLGAAAARFEIAIGKDPKLAVAHANLGVTLCGQSRVEPALMHLRQALALDPAFRQGWSSLLFTQNYSDQISPGDAFAHARAFSAMEDRARSPRRLPPPDPDPDRPLRVGFVSPDFRQHSVNFFFEPLLEEHDRKQFTFVAYSDVLHPDAATHRLKRGFEEWRDIAALPDEKVLPAIDADRIDILVDLAGHTAFNRMALFARRAAPLQISYCGFPSTTGLATMDGRITDAWADPPGMTEGWHTETLLRMNSGFLCYRPAPHAPVPARSPRRRPSEITFGTFNHLAKMSPTILRIWARLLAQLPRARLMIKGSSLSDPDTRVVFSAKLGAAGLPLGRVDLRGYIASESSHLAAYNDIDVALDTWPYNGTTTTCEALWMGVPVVTLAGNVHAARVGVSLLSQVGLQDLAANDPEGYLARAARLAADPQRQRLLRNNLRSLMRSSPLMDAVGKARAFERVLRQAWQTRVAT